MIKKKLEKVFRQNFKKVKIKDNFNKMSMLNTPGWDSVGHVNFLLSIENKFKVKFTSNDFFKLNDISKILKRLKK